MPDSPQHDSQAGGAQPQPAATLEMIRQLRQELEERRRAEEHYGELYRQERAAREAAETRAQAEAAARREVEDRHRSLIEQSSEGIYLLEFAQPVSVDEPEDQQIRDLFEFGFVAECNDAMARMYGLSSAGELLGRRLGQMLDRSDPHTDEYLRAAIRSGYDLSDAESHEVDVQGAPKYFLNNFVGVIRENKLVCLWGTQRDITLRKLAEEALRASEARFRIMADSAPVMIWISDRDKHRTWFNKAWLDFRGRSMQQEYGSGWIEGVHPDDVDRCIETSVSAFDERRPFTMEYRLRRKDGEYRWIVDTGVQFTGAGGEFEGYIGSCIDIDERHRLEQERLDLLHRERRARAEAETANRRKDQFLAVLSHELRTPLTPVLARLALLKRKPSLPQEMHHDLEMIRRNVELEAHLINDLLDLSKIAHGLLQLRFQRVDAHERIQDALDVFQSEIEAKGLHVKMRLEAARHHVRADPVRLEQIFWNLISNGVKYTPGGGCIGIRSSNEGDLLKVEVSDSGIGIEPQTMARLFNAFEQGEETLSRRYGGLGLGLSISKTLVELHGGSISAFSAGRDKGSTFTVKLPVVSPVPAEAPPTPAEAAPPAKALKVLLVEDNKDTQRALTRLLRMFGHEVRTAETAESAVTIGSAEPFDLLICDIGLPDATGWEVMRQLREHRPVTGIALSGYTTDEDIRKSKEAGFIEHLAKPVAPDKLEAVIQELAR